MNSKLCFITAIMAMPALNSFGQDPQFTQFYANPLYLNPAFTGTPRCPRMIVNWRDEWPAISGTFVTYNGSFDQYVDVLSGGLGLIVTHDNAGEGTINTTYLGGIYSYRLNVSRAFSIQAALQASYIYKTLDWNKLTFGDMIDKRYGFIYDTKETKGIDSRGSVDFSAGILGFSKTLFGGFAAHHITQPYEGFVTSTTYRLPLKMTGHFGGVFPIDESGETKISPNILFKRQQDFWQTLLGLYVSRGPIVGGVWFRQAQKTSDSFIALLGFQYEMVKIGYSYDVTLSKLANATSGSHEISFQIQFECKPKTRKFRPISCPSF
ncbi:MAG: PorP/SprF family type IX secretion system membrane protein [Bacteroidetes bacterium]|nr:PorP/SprF family type IX secretion system membrane protein [Bacteroidota bacterium]